MNLPDLQIPGVPSQYMPYVTFLLMLVLSVAHMRGNSLPLLSYLLNKASSIASGSSQSDSVAPAVNSIQSQVLSAPVANQSQQSGPAVNYPMLNDLLQLLSKSMNAGAPSTYKQ